MRLDRVEVLSPYGYEVRSIGRARQSSLAAAERPEGRYMRAGLVGVPRSMEYGVSVLV